MRQYLWFAAGVLVLALPAGPARADDRWDGYQWFTAGTGLSSGALSWVQNAKWIPLPLPVTAGASAFSWGMTIGRVLDHLFDLSQIGDAIAVASSGDPDYWELYSREHPVASQLVTFPPYLPVRPRYLPDPKPVYVDPKPVYVSPKPVYVSPKLYYVSPKPVYVSPKLYQP
jgi:hypothetical protein